MPVPDPEAYAHLSALELLSTLYGKLVGASMASRDLLGHLANDHYLTEALRDREKFIDGAACVLEALKHKLTDPGIAQCGGTLHNGSVKRKGK